MSSRTPWHKHLFSPGVMTKNSCVVCGGKVNAVQHQLAEEKVEVNTPEWSGVMCQQCGSEMVRTGACHTCPSCGENTGCG